MRLRDTSALVTGGASGLGLATARALLEDGVRVTILDLPTSAGAQIADELGPAATFVAADVTDAGQVQAAVDVAADRGGLRALVHCAGRGGPVRIVDREGNPGSLEVYEQIVRVNLIGTFNVLRIAAAAMAQTEPIDGERGVCVLTASVAAYEGQIGQAPYASAKAGVVGLTLVAARDLASRQIRVCSIAPGLFDTPILARLSASVRESLAGTTPHPSRFGRPSEFAMLARQVIENPMLNGEVIRLDGAIRMTAR